jgi:anhydro-N-acetylmuramic acid kinase
VCWFTLQLQDLVTKSSRLTLGLMSGTSADGVDIAACEVSVRERILRNLAAETYPYPTQLRHDVLRLASSQSVEIKEMMTLSQQLGYFYSEVIDQFLESLQLQSHRPELIGSHGQTIAHLGERQKLGDFSSYATLQLGEAEIIAKRSGIVTVSDFRSGDIAVRGAGAPLTPIYHALRFAEPGKNCAVVNIGGIANVTLLKSDGNVIGSDSGPGNCLIDVYISRHSGQPFDRNGDTARRGNAHLELANKLAGNPLFSRRIPRSYDRAEVIRLIEAGESKSVLDELPLEDAIATLSHLTSITIRQTIAALSEDTLPESILVCGGGAFNSYLMDLLRQEFDLIPVSSTSEYGSDPDFVEAEAFAYLANLTLDSIAGNLPQVTGASRPAILGKISQP